MENFDEEKKESVNSISLISSINEKLKFKTKEDELEMFKKYDNSMYDMAESLRINNPESYEKAQGIGLHMMECEYDLNHGEDIKGEKIKVDMIYKNLNSGYLDVEDLDEDDVRLLKKYNLEI
jgi:hypothetical protein